MKKRPNKEFFGVSTAPTAPRGQNGFTWLFVTICNIALCLAVVATSCEKSQIEESEQKRDTTLYVSGANGMVGAYELNESVFNLVSNQALYNQIRYVYIESNEDFNKMNAQIFGQYTIIMCDGVEKKVDFKGKGKVNPETGEQADIDRWNSWGFTAAPVYVQHDTRYVFNQDYIDEIYPTDKIKASSDSIEVRDVCLIPNKHFKNFQTNNITIMINNVLRPAIEVSQKVKGEGNFEFRPGVATATDSTWLVKHGWTVNHTK